MLTWMIDDYLPPKLQPYARLARISSDQQRTHWDVVVIAVLALCLLVDGIGSPIWAMAGSYHSWIVSSGSLDNHERGGVYDWDQHPLGRWHRAN
jgi:hypothetical protein